MACKPWLVQVQEWKCMIEESDWTIIPYQNSIMFGVGNTAERGRAAILCLLHFRLCVGLIFFWTGCCEEKTAGGDANVRAQLDSQ